jgi:hypothetical protein
MPVNVYLWQENFYCEGDIVSVLTDHEPWSAWIEAGYEPGTDEVEVQLTQIARMVHVNRANAGSVRRGNFPVKLDAPPSDPTAFCRACLHWFTLPETSTDPPETTTTDGRPSVTEGETMSAPSALMRHADAMLHPQGEAEETIASLVSHLARLGDRFAGDETGLDVVEKLGAAIISLLQNGDAGRFDKHSVDKQVRDIVKRAGGDSNGL